MLRFLKVSHLAVIDAVEVEFDAGLNVLTGETGAGKSILVEAVGLLLGGRASGDLVRTGEEQACIEAIFESGGEELLVRREITTQGRSRAFVNGALVTAGALRDLSSRLVELHGQHEHQTLLDPTTHLGVLDTFGGLTELRAPTTAAFEAVVTAREALARVKAAAKDRDARLELITFQLTELDRAALKTPTLTATSAKMLSFSRFVVLASAERVERLVARATVRSTRVMAQFSPASGMSGAASPSWLHSIRSSSRSLTLATGSNRNSRISRCSCDGIRTASRRLRRDCSRWRNASPCSNA